MRKANLDRQGKKAERRMRRKGRTTTTVELFAGIGGFRLAADRLGLKTVWANDIDPKACGVYRTRFGTQEIVEGDINILLDRIPPHGLLTAGFPCQPFSSAGKKEGIRDPRGTLFEAIVEVLRAREPGRFVLENVKRLLSMEKGSHFATILDALAGLSYRIEWRLLNATEFGLPQNRQRVFIIGVHERELHSSARTREVAPIRLASEEDLLRASHNHHDLFLSSRGWKPIAKHLNRWPSWGMAQSGKFCGAELETFSMGRRAGSLEGVLQSDVPSSFDFTDSTRSRLHRSRAVNRFVQGVEILSNQGGGARMGYTVFGVKGVAPALTATPSRHYERYFVNGRFRRLTNVEYARLQGFPEKHCSSVSVYDQYALYGNAVPPPMAEWVLKALLSERVVHMPKPAQGALDLYEPTNEGFA